MMLTKIAIAAAAIGLAVSGPLSAADGAKDEHKAERQRIEKEAKAARDKCRDMKGNAKDICMAEARGQEKVAKAELEAKRNDTPKTRYNVAAARADMDYTIAREKCDEMKGKEKDQCQKDARAARNDAKKKARAERDAADKGRKESRRAADKGAMNKEMDTGKAKEAK